MLDGFRAWPRVLDEGQARATVERMSLTNIVAQNLRAVRAQQKLSQQAVAKKARVSISYVSMLERGERTPPLNTLETLAKALDVSPLYLLQELSTERPRSRR